MSHRFLPLCTAAAVLLGAPAVSWAQNNCCCKKSSSMTGTWSPNTPWTNCTPSRTSFQNPLSPNSLRIPNLPTNIRQGNQPRISLSRQQDPQLQQAVIQNQWMQQTMMQQQLLQYQLQDQVKQQLLLFAVDAPTENLQRELKNSNAFVRWAASVELNRRWKLEKSVADAEVRLAKALAARPVETPPAEAPAAAPRRVRAETPALVRSTSNDQSLLLQYGIPNSQ